MGVLAVSEIGPGLIHVFAEDGGASSIAGFTNYSSFEDIILWAFAALGGSQIFVGLLYLAVLLNLFDSRHLAAPLLGWTALKATWSLFIPWILNKDLEGVAPNAPGRFKPIISALISLIGIADELITKAEIFDWYI